MSATKRKLADAFHSLDQAVEGTPPAKRAHTARSLYATLAKYGVKQKPSSPSLSKSTPHLTAILARAATRTRKALPFTFGNTPPPPLPPTAEYRPSSIPSFLARLATFKLVTYANKPPQIDAVAAAKCGWINDGRDRLVCGLCGVSWVVASRRDGMSRDAVNALVEKQRTSLVDMHKNGCPWKTRQCDPSIYRIPLQAPAVTIREIKTTALVLHPIMQEMEVKHPLSANQLATLRATITAFSLPPPSEDAASAKDATPPPAAEDATPPLEPSETAILTALFGWAPAPPAPERPRVSSLSRPVSRSVSRAGSPFPSTPLRPSHSRASSFALPSTSAYAATSAAASASTSALPLSSSTATAPFLRRISSTASMFKRDTSLLQCALCQRRVGLWAFAPPTEPIGTPPPHPRAPPPQRHFDLLKEHRSFCPYVVRSTLVPTLPAEPSPSPSPSAGVLEGWRAVLTVVLRYGMGQRQRMAALRRKHSEGGDTGMDVDDASVDGVEAMVATVKSRGGKELLKYVKGLLG
ncbi:C3HC zinc finger-like-domain-containing protein [Mycena rosella]|uniref:C3HC zinc finger-like-domain-containing protein n=1 Tax=Mycena rosella TaxID=1033263 RepID=A0AAD7CRR5_MYCRO|nr:C3HC zinc finger-like-domain-containing protein [Mycena rosella]